MGGHCVAVTVTRPLAGGPCRAALVGLREIRMMVWLYDKYYYNHDVVSSRIYCDCVGGRRNRGAQASSLQMQARVLAVCLQRSRARCFGQLNKGTISNRVTSTRPLSEIRNSGMTTSESKLSCMKPLLIWHPHSISASFILSAFWATFSAR